MTYSVIIGVYRGIKNLPAILSSLKSQTVLPQAVFIWSNTPINAMQDAIVVQSYNNIGCFARFSLAGMCQSEAVMVLDDDTVPGHRWAENCIATMNRLQRKAILGCRGIILTKAAYTPFKEAGIAAHNDHTQECDLVGHSWFFMREHAHFMFDKLPHRWDTGEDMHFSAYAKMAGIRTYCPAHPAGNKAFWGSTQRGLGNEPGRISTSQGLQPHFDKRSAVVKNLIAAGWKPCFMEKQHGNV